MSLSTVWDAALEGDVSLRSAALAGTCAGILREAGDIAASARVAS